MNRWRRTILTAAGIVALAAITLGAGAVLGGSQGPGGSQVVPASKPPGADHDGEPGRHDVRVFHLGGGAWLGVEIEEVSDEKAGELGLGTGRGALVTGVEDDSPAAKAGIREGDVILGFDGERIVGVRTLRRLVAETPPARTVRLDLFRGGREMTVEARLEERPAPSGFHFDGEGDHEIDIDIPDMDIRIPKILRITGRPVLGVSVDEMNPQLAEFLGVRDEEGGLFVKEVLEGTPAERAGLKAGDVILEADGRKIGGLLDLRETLRGNAGKTIPLRVVRDRSARTLEVTLDEDDGEPEIESHWRMKEGERREIERALREAGRAQREAMRSLRDQMRELERLRSDEEGLPRLRRALGPAPVEI